MSEPASEQNPIDRLADDFLERYRRGQRPSFTEYAEKHPELAEDIRELFPALVVMERLGPQPDDLRPQSHQTVVPVLCLMVQRDLNRHTFAAVELR